MTEPVDDIANKGGSDLLLKKMHNYFVLKRVTVWLFIPCLVVGSDIGKGDSGFPLSKQII